MNHPVGSPMLKVGRRYRPPDRATDTVFNLEFLLALPSALVVVDPIDRR